MESVLCFINGPWAYFTTRALSDQYGDNWNNKPWTEAGSPYLHRHYNPELDKLNKWEIYKIAYSGFWTLPYAIYPDLNHPTVLSINNDNSIPWLCSSNPHPKPIEVMAGTTLSNFCKLMRENGGYAYIPV